MKTRITIRVDDDVLEWFKSQGRGYQTLINKILSDYCKDRMEVKTAANKIRKIFKEPSKADKIISDTLEKRGCKRVMTSSGDPFFKPNQKTGKGAK